MLRWGALVMFLVVCGSAAARPDAGRVLWRGDYETGTLDQWLDVQAACNGRGHTPASVGRSCASIVSSPRREGAHAARFQIRPHRAGVAEAERSEVLVSRAVTGGFEGQAWYYAWSTMFPARGNRRGFSGRFGDWNVFTDFHNVDGPCAANVNFGIDATSPSGAPASAPRVYFSLVEFAAQNCRRVVSRRKHDLGSLRFDHWYDFVLRVRWSADPGVGFVELWVDGERAVPLSLGATMHNRNGVYWKQGFYRAAYGATNTVYHDGARRGSSLAAVGLRGEPDGKEPALP